MACVGVRVRGGVAHQDVLRGASDAALARRGLTQPALSRRGARRGSATEEEDHQSLCSMRDKFVIRWEYSVNSGIEQINFCGRWHQWDWTLFGG